MAGGDNSGATGGELATDGEGVDSETGRDDDDSAPAETPTTEPPSEDEGGSEGDSGGEEDETSGTSTGGDPMQPPVDPVEVQLSNVPDPCMNPGGIVPTLPDDADFVVATILTPEQHPFTVTHVEYELFGQNPPCNSTLPHIAYAFPVTDGIPTMPSAGPWFKVATLPLDTDAGESRLVELELEHPVELVEGQSLAVAVRMAVNASITETLCMMSCDDVMEPGVDFWSNAADEPYDWEDMIDSFGLTNSIVRAYGYAEPES